MKEFLEKMQASFPQKGGKEILQEIRQESWERLLAIGFPHKKSEGFATFPFDSYYGSTLNVSEAEVRKEEISLHVDPLCEHSYLVFVNGKFRADLSDMSGIEEGICLPFKEALATYGGILKKHLIEQAKEENNPFHLLNQSETEGVFVYLPPGKEVKRVVQSIHFIKTTQNIRDKGFLVLGGRIHLFLGKNSRLRWVNTEISNGESMFWSHRLFDLSLEEGATFSLIEERSREGQMGYYLNALRAKLKKRASLHHFSLSKGVQKEYRDIRVKLLGEESEANLKGLSLLSGKSHVETKALVQHQVERTKSNQKFKTVLEGRAHFSFSGEIRVEKEAQKTEAYQLSNALLLSNEAVAISRPNLQIFADDVKASHGATISIPREEELFYLKSRGIHEEEAKKHLTLGFCRELTEELFLPQLRL